MEINSFGEELKFQVEGSGFLYKMVRSMVGALFEVGRGKIDYGSIKDILNTRKRTEVVVSSPAKGLSLEQVFYTISDGLDE